MSPGRGASLLVKKPAFCQCFSYFLVRRGQCLRDGLRKLAVYETSWLRNMQRLVHERACKVSARYDLEGVAKAAEDCDALRELQSFIETSSKEVRALNLHLDDGQWLVCRSHQGLP